MLVVFRTDASVQIGTGHVMRCLTLADELTREGYNCWFVCREHKGNLGDLIRSKGYGLSLLPVQDYSESIFENNSQDDYMSWLGASWQEDANQTLNAIKSLNPDWLVVDHYALDAEWEGRLAASVSNILAIDDLANRDHKCTLLLDQNLGRLSSDYDKFIQGKCIRLVGPRYALLRPEFAEYREESLKRRGNPEFNRILISLGGIDRDNVTGKILDALSDSGIPSDTELDVIMGGSAPHLCEIRKQVSDLPFRANVSVNVKDMAERMYLADLSIGAAGGTSWERCCLGLPTLLIILAENQVAGAKALEASGAAVIIENAYQIKSILPSELVELNNPSKLRTMIDAAAKISDGCGVLNVVREMNNISEKI
ncbi:MAG: UDP-2,4-diacetamido-2,4,6-trideoxy-beta-L-altropyranose hydrolase [Pseudomonadota bacterium]|nr:UDP-2,4-diacetamido-2,4,6-trideoxy-beta-L-altropyranose hydrolase [Pseudomonadota bacterium]